MTILLVVAAAPELEASGGVHAENETPAVALGANFDPLPVATAVYVPNDGAYEANARVGPAGEPFTFHR